MKQSLLIPALFSLLFFSCKPDRKSEVPHIPEFEWTVISDQADLWWARSINDIDSDGLSDVILSNHNGYGGWVGWFKADTSSGNWKLNIIVDSLKNGMRFAGGDIASGDIDGDGDIDVISFAHPGEWKNGSAPSELFWFENPSWEMHYVGQASAFVKDVNLADLNNNGSPEIVTLTFNTHQLCIFSKDGTDSFEQVLEMEVYNLHEGMDVGDLDGNGLVDIAFNGYWLKNNSEDLRGDWELLVIDSTWFNQTGDWSGNATKTVCEDIDQDGKDEVFVSHSERDGYPVALYDLIDIESNNWIKTVIIDTLPAAHNLQLADFNMDGRIDLVTGVNTSRAMGLEIQDFPVYLLLNNPEGWEKIQLTEQGSYNINVGDIDGDGFPDLIHLPTHDGTVLSFLKNLTGKDKPDF